MPYLRDLGVSHLYLSPAFAARAGSTHGYDVIDPTRLSDALGGEAGFRALAAAARDAGLGIVLDIVPEPHGDRRRQPVLGRPGAARAVLRPRPGDRPPPALLRHRPPRGRAPGGPGGVRRDARARAGAGRARGSSTGCASTIPTGSPIRRATWSGCATAAPTHVWVEKILDPGEPLRDWPVEGTVGYEFLNDVAALFVDPAGEAPLTALWEELAGDARPFGDWAAEAKLEQARTTFAPDVDWLRRLWPEVEGLEEALAALPVYRTYIRDLPAPEDLHVLREAGLVEWLAQAPRDFVTRFQQTTPPIMAKGVEDTAFYRYVRLLALNDVGGDPSRWSHRRRRRSTPATRVRAERFPRGLLITPDARHEALGRRRAPGSARWPGWRTSGRTRCGRWRELCAPLRADGAPDAIEEYTIFQTLVGAWPLEPERLCAYMEKAMREAKRNTTLGGAGRRAGRGACSPTAARSTTTRRSAPRSSRSPARVAAVGERHALRQTALKLTVPGVPDIYQGDELVALSLVDPDNRRPVDWARRRALLGAAPADRRHAQAVADPRAARAARAPPGRVRGRLRAARRGRRTRSRSCAATTSRSRCRSAESGLDFDAAAGRLAPGRRRRPRRDHRARAPLSLAPSRALRYALELALARQVLDRLVEPVGAHRPHERRDPLELLVVARVGRGRPQGVDASRREAEADHLVGRSALRTMLKPDPALGRIVLHSLHERGAELIERAGLQGPDRERSYHHRLLSSVSIPTLLPVVSERSKHSMISPMRTAAAAVQVGDEHSRRHPSRTAHARRRRAGGRRAGVPRAGRAVPPCPGDPLLPDARLAARRRGRRPGDAAARVARARPLRAPRRHQDLALPDRDERVPGRDRAPAAAARAGAALPRRAARGGGVADRRSRRPLRAARGHGARVPHDDPAAAGPPARGADPARRARLDRARGGRPARLDGRRGHERAAARAGDGRPRAAGPARAGRGAASARCCAATSTAWEQVDVDGLVALLREDAAMRMPPQRTLAGRHAIVAFWTGRGDGCSGGRRAASRRRGRTAGRRSSCAAAASRTG